MILSFFLTPYTLLLLPILYYILPYFRATHLLSIPGPPLARFTNLWLLYHARRAQRSQAVDEAHATYGPIIRIAPNHISIASDAAIQEVYGHGNGFLKSSFYDAFVSIHRGMFNVRDRAQHTRKRKIVSNTFSAKSIGLFEPYVHSNLELFVKQWDGLAEKAKTIGDGYARFDALNWFNYLAFDVIGDLAFGAPFGMLERGKDLAEVRTSPDAKPTYCSAIQVLNRRGEVSAYVTFVVLLDLSCE
jgi:benzoate 4-monooxygenase